MHHIYRTKAFVLKTSPVGEESGFCFLLTRDIGLIAGRAQGVRREHSKLRFALQDFSLCQVSLVRGKEVWRIINAIPEENAYDAMKDKPEHFFVCARISALIRRLVSGEEPNPALFDLVEMIMTTLVATSFSKDELRVYEPLAVVRILSLLGYEPLDATIRSFSHLSLSKEDLQKASPYVSHIVQAINVSLQASQM